MFRNSAPVLRVAIISMFVVIVGAYLVALMIDGATLDHLAREDGPIETVGAVCFLVAAVGFFALYILAAKDGRDAPGLFSRRAAVFGLLALLMFVCFGEEISWGQRVFGWSTPGLVCDLNAQDETNLHNLQLVHQLNPDGSEKGFVEKLVNMNRLFSIFWLAVFVVVPVTARLSARARRLLHTAGIVIPPLWAGGLFLTSYVVYKLVAFIHAGSIRAAGLDELKETSYAAIYAFLACVALVADLRRR